MAGLRPQKAAIGWLQHFLFASIFLFMTAAAAEVATDAERGLISLWRGDQDEARELLRRGATEEGPLQLAARMELLRLTARLSEGDRAAVAAVRRELNILAEEPGVESVAWYAAMLAFWSGGHAEAALELAVALPAHLPTSREAASALFLSAWLMEQSGQPGVALERIFLLLDSYPQSEWEDDAHYLAARIYTSPGRYFQPDYALGALYRFEERFPESIWLEPVNRLKRQFGAGAGR